MHSTTAPRRAPSARSQRWWRASAIAVGLGMSAVLAISGCTVQPVSTGAGSRDLLRLATPGGGGQESLDPQVLVSDYDILRADAIFDHFVDGPESLDGETNLGIAQSIEPNGDASVWTMSIRQGITFHDGTPLTSADVAYSLERALSKDSSLPVAEALSSSIDLNRIEIIDDDNLIIVLNAPAVGLPDLLYTKGGGVVKNGATAEELEENPIGTGPFTFVASVPGEGTTLAKNEDYWQDGLPVIDDYEIVVIDDENSALNALRSGQIDMYKLSTYSLASSFESDPQFELLTTPGSTYVATFMQIDSPEFSDPRVREALKLAIDREAIVDTIYAGYAEVGNDVFGLGWPSYDTDLEQREYDPERAKELLQEAGVEDFEVTLYTSDGGAAAGQLAMSQAMAEQAKAAGITINLQEVTPGDYYNFDLYYMNEPFYQTNWGDVTFESLAGFFTCDAGETNETKWCNPEFDALVAQASATVDSTERTDLWHQAQQIMWEDGGYLIPAFGDSIYVANANLGGFHPRKYLAPAVYRMTVDG